MEPDKVKLYMSSTGNLAIDSRQQHYDPQDRNLPQVSEAAIQILIRAAAPYGHSITYHTNWPWWARVPILGFALHLRVAYVLIRDQLVRLDVKEDEAGNKTRTLRITLKGYAILRREDRMEGTPLAVAAKRMFNAFDRLTFGKALDDA